MKWLRAVGAGGLLAAWAALVAWMALPADAASVTIVDNAYQPADRTVTLGDTVTWCNHGDNTHSVTEYDGLFNSRLEPDRCFSFKPPALGAFRYDCNFENMRGLLTVTSAPAPTTAPVSPPPAPAPPPPPPGVPPPPPPAAAGPTTTVRGAKTTTTTRPKSDAPGVTTVEPAVEVPIIEPTDESQSDATTTTTTAAGQFAINELNPRSDSGQTFAVLMSAGIVVLGGGYLAYHLRFGRR